MMSGILNKLLLAILLPVMLLLVAAPAFYLGNRNELTFSLADVWLPISGIALLSSLVLLLLLKGLGRFHKASAIVSGLLLGFAIAVWVQSQLLVWNFGPLDGRGIDWSPWSTHMLLEGVMWLGLPTAGVCMYLSGRRKPADTMVQAFLVLGLVSVISASIMAPERTAPVSRQPNEMEGVFQFHPDRNVVVIILDTFQSDYFELIATNHPQEIAFLDGFIFYRNTISPFPTTAPNIPAIMTARIYDNQRPFNEYLGTVYQSYNIVSSFSDSGFSSRAVGVPNVVPGATSMSAVLDSYSPRHVAAWVEFLDYALFRTAPTYLKKHVYNNGDWLLSFMLRGDYPPDAHGVDIRFLELFEREAAISVDTSAGAFRFYHFIIPHAPWRVDENLRFNPELRGPAGYKRQARGALKVARRMLEKLHELGIYHSSEIVIMADHGTLTIPPLSRRTDKENALTAFSERVHSSSLALLLHKRPGASGPVTVDDAPLYLSDLSCLLRVSHENLDCSGFDSAVATGERQRTYFYYDWRNEYWQRDYMPTITEYSVNGHAHDMNSWQIGNYILAPGSRTQRDAFRYRLGSLLAFTEAGNSNYIVRGGWGGQETRHRWTTARQSALVVRLDKVPASDLVLKLRGQAYLARGEIDRQLIGVRVNGRQVAQWRMRGEEWFEAPIPASLVGEDGLLNVVFQISNPAAPADFGHSADPRKLGMAVKELVISEYPECRQPQVAPGG
jgi:hypothetical protein